MRFLTTLAIAMPAALAYADGYYTLTEAQLDSLEQRYMLQDVVVTGTRTPKTLKDTPVQTRLIGSADLKAADATNLQDLLQAELPGVEFTYAMNQQTNMNLAGFAGQSVLILLDGERLAGETMDNVDFSRLVMSGVDRIEVVKGAASALYGSNAAGGVINIITKKAKQPWRVNLNARAADHNEWRFGAEIANKGKHVSNVLDVNYSTIDTYTVCMDPSDECDFRSVYGYKTWNFQDRLTFSPTNKLSLTARAGYYYKERYYNVDTPDRYRDFNAGLRGEWLFDPNGTLEVSYAFDQYDKSDFIKAQGLDVRDYRNVQNSLRALVNYNLTDDYLLSVGADFTHDYLDTYQFAPGESKEQNSADAFAQLDWNISPSWEVIGAVRYDYFSDTKDSHFTAKASGRYRTGNLTFRGGYAGGFRSPSLKERYMNFDMAGIFDIHGNPDLKSELSHNFNISAEYAYRNYNFTIGGNYTLVDNKISTSGVVYAEDGTPYIDYINVRKLKVSGLDATAQARWTNGMNARLSYAYTREETVGGSITQYCPARPHALNARVGWTHDWTRDYATEIIVSGRFLSRVSYESMYMYEPFETKTIVNPAYTLWKVQLNQTICDGILVTLAVDNIFNYAPAVYSYNAPITLGANLMVGASIDLEKIF